MLILKKRNKNQACCTNKENDDVIVGAYVARCPDIGWISGRAAARLDRFLNYLFRY